MYIQVPEGALSIIQKLQSSGYEAYIVGGCVRDSVLGRNPKDWDICTSAIPDEVIKLFNDIEVIPTGIKHGTVTLIEKDGNYEVTTFRIDGEYKDHRRPESVSFTSSLYKDLARRDFTINAMAYDPIKNKFVDPFNGRTDIQRKLIRCVGDPDKRFSEDALRILRGVRFASELGFDIDETTAISIHKNVMDLLKIASERVTTELSKLLIGQSCTKALCEYKDVIAVILPEMSSCIGFDQHNRYHCYDVYDHIAHAVGNYNGNDIITKYALLFHDIGKPMCYTEDERGGHFYGHGKYSVELTKSALTHLRLPADHQKKILELVKIHDADIPLKKKAIRKWISKVGEEQFKRYLDLHRADVLAHSTLALKTSWGKYEAFYSLYREILAEESCMSLKKLAVNGYDIIKLGIKEGRQIGKILNYLLDAVIAEEVENKYDDLLQYAMRYIENQI